MKIKTNYLTITLIGLFKNILSAGVGSGEVALPANYGVDIQDSHEDGI